MPETDIAHQMQQPPRWVRTPEALRALAAHFVGADAMALDTESDSLHHFPDECAAPCSMKSPREVAHIVRAKLNAVLAEFVRQLEQTKVELGKETP